MFSGVFWAKVAFVLAFSYFVGGIPFSLIVGKMFFQVDPREYGSGNLGATNTLRTLGTRAGIAVLLLDGFKGAITVLLAGALFPVSAYGPAPRAWMQVIAMVVTMLGHAFSPYIGFKGGKGIAAAAGAVFAFQPKIAFLCFVIFVLVVLATRYVSLGSIAIGLMYPVGVLLFYPEPPYIIFAILVAALVVYLHRSNIRRLLSGTENRITFSRTGTKTPRS